MEGAEVVALEPQDTSVEEVVAEEDAQPEEVPSVFSVTNRYLVGSVDIGDTAEDGSRLLRLYSASGAAVIEANLSPQVWAFIKAKSSEIQIVKEEDEAADAEPSATQG